MRILQNHSSKDSWPTIAEWVRFVDAEGSVPRLLESTPEPTDPMLDSDVDEAEDAAFGESVEFEWVTEAAQATLSQAWTRAGEWVEDTGDGTKVLNSTTVSDSARQLRISCSAAGSLNSAAICRRAVSKAKDSASERTRPARTRRR